MIYAIGQRRHTKCG